LVEGLPKGFARPQYSSEYSTAPSISSDKKHDVGYMFSGNYTYKNIYLMDATVRVDGSSSFGKDSRYATFGSVGLGLNIHKYEFMKQYPWISQFKIRGSYGITGKANFPASTSKSVYSFNTDRLTTTGVAVDMESMGNDELKWEKTKVLDFGTTVGLFHNSLYFKISYYKKLTVDLISSMYLSSSSGFTSYKENVGEIENSGFELNARFVVVQNKDFQFYLSGSVSSNKNEITKLSNAMKDYNEMIEASIDTKPVLKFVEGASITSIYAMQSLGIDPQTGKELFLYKDGTAREEWLASENVAVGNTEPDFNGNFAFNLNYKNITLDAYFTYSYGGQMYNQTLQNKIENANIRENADKRVFDERWKEQGDITKFKALTDWTQTTKPTSRFVEDNNILELKSLSLGYSLPRELLKNNFLNNVKFTMTMNDVFRMSSIKQERGTSYPFARKFNLSCFISF